MLVIESIDAIRGNDLPYVGSALILFAKMLDLNLKSLLRLQFFYYIFSYFKVSIHLSLLIYQFSMNHFGLIDSEYGLPGELLESDLECADIE
jgi:hypothetical protein